MKIFVIIAAGGSGKRMGGQKQFRLLSGKPMLEWTVNAFKKVKAINGIIIATARENFQAAKKLGVKVCEGGKERQDSVANALKLVPPDTDIVLIHDGARPLITPAVIKETIKACKKFGAVVVGVPVKDTIKEISKSKIQNPNKIQIPNQKIRKTLDRRKLWAAQTPQVFKYKILMKAYQKARTKATDDSKLVEDMGIPVRMVMGSYENIKVTTPEDLVIAEAILCSRRKKKNL